jgi:hypothetical protein
VAVLSWGLPRPATEAINGVAAGRLSAAVLGCAVAGRIAAPLWSCALYEMDGRAVLVVEPSALVTWRMGEGDDAESDERASE